MVLYHIIFLVQLCFSTGKQHKTRFKPCIHVSPTSVTYQQHVHQLPITLRRQTHTHKRESGTTKDTKLHYGMLYYPYMTFSHDYNHPTCVRILWENWTVSVLLFSSSLWGCGFHWVNMYIFQLLWCWYVNMCMRDCSESSDGCAIIQTVGLLVCHLSPLYLFE